MRLERFTLIEGFATIEDCADVINRLFPEDHPKVGQNIAMSYFSFYRVQGMYYGVFMNGTTTQIVVSKKYVRCRLPECHGLFETSNMKKQHIDYWNFYGGSSRWNNTINFDAERELGLEEEVVRGNQIHGNRVTHWANNTQVLLNCLFADKTRTNDSAYY